VLTLMLGIGASSRPSSRSTTRVLKPLPFADSSRIVRVMSNRR
jgi:hypothetical protein